VGEAMRKLVKILDRDQLKISLEFKLVDLWVGVFSGCDDIIIVPDLGKVTRSILTIVQVERCWNVWICLCPCFPLHIMWKRKRKYNRSRLLANSSVCSCKEYFSGSEESDEEEAKAGGDVV
jgi:hypothetical protein